MINIVQINMEERLQKYLAECGIASRRKCEEIILEGRVKVNEKTITTLGTKIDPYQDFVEVDGKILKRQDEKIYILLNKPIGYVTTVKDQFKRDTVMDLLKDIKTRIVPVGRLDMYTSGALILSNDGEFVNRITHPSHEVEKTYNVTVRGKVTKEDMQKLENGVDIGDYVTKPAKTKILKVDENKNISAMEDEIDRITKIDLNKEYVNTKTYWRKYVKTHNGLNLKEAQNSYEDRIYEIYKRSILLFPLLTNSETGGIIASPEIDENFTKCGRYAYCWPRDAVFMTKAMDIVKMEKETEKFYKIFCKKTQSKNGMWEQRFYTDGSLAPCWGYQIDETASVVYGVYEHYKFTKSEKFLKDNLSMCEKAIDFLKKYVKDWLDIEGIEERDKDVVKQEIEEDTKKRTGKTHKYHISYDIWEMCEGIHLYSLASIYAAFESILGIYRVLGTNVSGFENNRLKEEKIQKNEREIERIQVGIKNYINENMYDETKKSYVRNPEDKKMDISILGAVTPFNIFKPKETKVKNTVESINLHLRTYTGGYQRFEQDNYMNGNPWPIANLWMTLYYLESGEKKKAKEAFDFVVKTAGKHYLLGEQVNNETLKPNWVIGLGWSHAMFLIVLEKLYGDK